MISMHDYLRRKPFVTLIAGAALVAAIMGCAEEPLDPNGGGDPTLEEIVLTPASVTLQPGEDRQFNAVGRMSDGAFANVSVDYGATGGSSALARLDPPFPLA